jgi:hypothetical protein
MAKKIKFNLIVDGNPIRNLDDLRNNFNLDDMIVHFRFGLLDRWLSVRGFDEHLRKVTAIKAKNIRNTLKIAEELVRIFELEASEEEIKEAIHAIDLRRRRIKTINDAKRDQSWRNKVLDGYHDKYEHLLAKLKPIYVISDTGISNLKGSVSSERRKKLRLIKGKSYSSDKDLMKAIEDLLGTSLNANQKK